MNKQNPIAFLTEKMWKYSTGGHGKIVIFSAMSLGANLLLLIQPLIVAAILNEVQKHDVTRQNLGWLFLIISLLLWSELGFWSLHGPSRVIEMCNAFMTKIHYKMYLLAGIFNLPLEWHANHHTGDTYDKQNKGTEALLDYSSGFFVIVSSGVRLVGSLAFLFYFDLVSGLVALASLVIAFAIMGVIDKTLVGQYEKLNKADNLISEKIHDAINNIITVIVLRVDSQFLKSIHKKMLEPLELFRKSRKLGEFKWFVASTFARLTVIVVVGCYLVKVAFGGAHTTVGTVYALIGYSQNFAELFYYFAEIYGQTLIRKASVTNSEELARQFVKGKMTVELNGKSHWQELKIENLSFSYDGGEDPEMHLENISLAVKRGERIALVGESGSGKTTLLKLFRNLYEPNSGAVYLDGKILPEGIGEISAGITLIPQDPEIFSTSILENITMGIDHEFKQVEKFAEIAQFHEVAERLPRKYESLIVEKGVNLSGGEKQRLALARGLLACQDKTIVLLDEPTSSIDLKNEWVIFQNIFREFEGKTIISTVHRLHLLPLFDSIYLFDDGRVIASGTFNQMMASNDVFREMWLKYQTINPNITPV